LARINVFAAPFDTAFASLGLPFGKLRTSLRMLPDPPRERLLIVSNPMAPDLRASFVLLDVDEAGYQLEHRRVETTRP